MTTPEHETVALVALLCDGRRKRTIDLPALTRTGGALAALEAEHGLLAAAELDRAWRDIDDWTSRGICVLSQFDAGYPANLLGVADRPPLLFMKGTLTAADEMSVAVVGTRRPDRAWSRHGVGDRSHLVGVGTP